MIIMRAVSGGAIHRCCRCATAPVFNRNEVVFMVNKFIYHSMVGDGCSGGVIAMFAIQSRGRCSIPTSLLVGNQQIER